VYLELERTRDGITKKSTVAQKTAPIIDLFVVLFGFDTLTTAKPMASSNKPFCFRHFQPIETFRNLNLAKNKRGKD